MRIERASTEEVRLVAFNMRDRDFLEFSGVSFVDTREDLANLLARNYGGRSDVMCGAIGDRPICIGGTLELRPNVITLLFFATPEFPEIALSITKFIRNELFPRFFANGIHRIEAVSLAEYSDVHKWLRSIGLTPETGPLKNYGKAGQSYIQFSKVANDCSLGV